MDIRPLNYGHNHTDIRFVEVKNANQYSQETIETKSVNSVDEFFGEYYGDSGDDWRHDVNHPDSKSDGWDIDEFNSVGEDADDVPDFTVDDLDDDYSDINTIINMEISSPMTSTEFTAAPDLEVPKLVHYDNVIRRDRTYPIRRSRRQSSVMGRSPSDDLLNSQQDDHLSDALMLMELPPSFINVDKILEEVSVQIIERPSKAPSELPTDARPDNIYIAPPIDLLNLAPDIVMALNAYAEEA